MLIKIKQKKKKMVVYTTITINSQFLVAQHKRASSFFRYYLDVRKRRSRDRVSLPVSSFESAETNIDKALPVLLLNRGSGLVGQAIRWVIANEAVGSKFGKKSENEQWIFLSSKEADLRWASFASLDLRTILCAFG